MQTETDDLVTCAAVLQVIADDMGAVTFTDDGGGSYAAALNSIAAQLIVRSQQSPRPFSV